jgi:hypothetical protein
MKYLRKFNESLSVKEELLDICDSYFAYLYDEGFKIECIDNYFSYIIKLTKEDNEAFTWDKVKDYYIPFLEVVNSKYILENFNASSKDVIGSGKNVSIHLDVYDRNYYSADDLIKDQVNICEIFNNFNRI